MNVPFLGKMAVNLIPEKKRQFQVFCVGLPRSGTHSIANLFRKNYRAEHEPYAGATIKLLLENYKNDGDRNRLIDHLKIKDQILQLELEAAHYLYKLVPELSFLFPESKFILTVREPRSWLESEINMNYRTRNSNIWTSLEYARYNHYNFEYESPKLEELEGIYPIASYLSYYVDHINSVLTNIPQERLLILDTYQLNNSFTELCEFTGAEKSKLNLKEFHSAKSKEKSIQLRDYIPAKILTEKIDSICKGYINEHLPMLEKYF